MATDLTNRDQLWTLLVALVQALDSCDTFDAAPVVNALADARNRIEGT